MRRLKGKSVVSPFSSFTSASNAADFPALKILFHADDFTAHAPTWSSRKGGIVVSFPYYKNNVLTANAGVAEKDADGVYTLEAFGTLSGNGWLTVDSGTMPTLSKYAVCVAIGRTPTTSATAGLGGTFGETETGPSLGTSGTAMATGVNQRNDVTLVTTLTPTTTVNKPSCVVSYFDLVDTSSPQILRAYSNNTDQVIGNFSTTTDDTLAINLGGALSSDVATAAFGGNNDGRRIKMFGLFDFNAPLTLAEIQLAAVEMARTKQLFAGWRNRAAA